MANFFTCPQCFEESACGCSECSTTDLLLVRMTFVDEDKAQCPHCGKFSLATEWLELSEILFKARIAYRDHLLKKAS